jgi:hypothetical protein
MAWKLVHNMPERITKYHPKIVDKARFLARSAKPSWWTLLRWTEFMWLTKSVLTKATSVREKMVRS